MFKRILVGFDGTPSAREALRVALTLARMSGGEATALVVASATKGETPADGRAAFDAEVEPLRAAIQHELDAAARYGAQGRMHVAAGERPADVLSTHAREHGYDLVVVGRYGRDQAVHSGLGSVARQLVDKGECPVLLVGTRFP